MDTWWLIEMQGPAYLSARHCGGYEFFWTDDVYKAIRFAFRDQADLTMMAVRQLRGDLFPPCLVRVPCAVEHVFAPGGPPHRRELSPSEIAGNSYKP